MFKSCTYCGKIHDVKFRCPSKSNRGNWAKGNSDDIRTKIRKFRDSPKWRSKRDEIQERDLRLCQICIRELFDTIDKFTYESTSVHHIIPLVDNWDKRLDDDNLIVLCSRHHVNAERGFIPANLLMEIVMEQNREKL